tara:strand:- start:788 stop:1960 length:1173 start_codon:yes stop_codon:yes gene_type:complete
MKDNDKAQNNISANNTVTPQSAMDDYFSDMFGSPEEHPLQELAGRQGSDNAEISKHDIFHKAKETKSASKPKLKPKKQKTYSSSLYFDEPEIPATNISPLIIPAAFPKLAPIQIKAVPKGSAVTASKVSSSNLETIAAVSSKTSANVKNKLNAKTALALLEKQKAKLSISQQQRLQTKLQQLSKAKNKLVSQQGTSANKELSREKDLKQKVEVTSVKASEQKIITRPDLHIQKNIKPDWAESRFECLIFTVAGLKLAVPLISLGAIYKIEKDLTPLVGRVSWFMGLYHYLDRNVRVIDTAQLVMPERYTSEVRSAYKFIIRLGGNDWGIACDAVHQSIQLSPEQIKWRTERSKRAWLFGTVIDHMCALIDTDSLSTMLDQHGTKKPSIFS